MPADPSRQVGLFVCGPTVYDLPHLGHAKTYTHFDFLARLLVQNITDVDDKIIRRARELRIDAPELARMYERAYLDDMRALRNDSVDVYARASDYIDQVISQIERLQQAGRGLRHCRRHLLRPDRLPWITGGSRGVRTSCAATGSRGWTPSPQRDSRSGFRVLVVARAVAVVIEPRDFFRVEARGVPPDGVGAMLVRVLGVSDQVSLGHVEALRFALAGLDQRRDRGIDVVVGVLGPSRHVLRLLQPFALSIARANRLRATASAVDLWMQLR